MALTMAQKLRIKEGMTLLTVNAPAEFAKQVAQMQPGVKVTTKGTAYNQVHWFVKTRAEMEKEVEKVIKLLKGDVVCWIYYPKGTSKIQTDLTRDKGWDSLLSHTELQWLSLVSFDDTWSSFGMRLKTEADKKKEAAPKERAIFEYADSATKTIRLPDDLAKALKKSRDASTWWDALAFSHKREYVEWIITAKREETRNERVAGTIERLEKSWKNPRNI